jgi:hypothetical protein
MAHEKHDHLKEKALKAIAGKKGVPRTTAFLQNLTDDLEAFYNEAQAMTKDQILAEGADYIATMKAHTAEFAKALSA